MPLKTNPSPQKAASRMYALLGVAAVGLIQNDLPEATAEEARQDILKWLHSLELGAELESEEQKFMELPTKLTTKQQRINASWRFEGVAVLAWALQLFDKGSEDKLVSPPALTEALKFLSPDARIVIGRAELRPQEELKKYLDKIFSIHWRLIEHKLRQEKKDFSAIVKKSSFGLTLEGLDIIDGDLAIAGRPIFAYDPEDLTTLHSLVRERHIAMEWLFGQDEFYNKVIAHT